MIIGDLTFSLASTFPVILPSTNTVNESLTIYNTFTTEYGLSVAFNWGIVGLTLTVIYFLIQKKIMPEKIDDMDYGH